MNDPLENQENSIPENNGLIGWFVHNRVASTLLLILIILIGWSATQQINVQNYPQFKTRTILIELPVPGFSQREIYEDFVEQLESPLIGLEGIRRVISNTRQGIATIGIDIEPDVNENRVLSDVKDLFDDFPSLSGPNVRNPRVSILPFGNDVLTIAVTSDFASQYELNQEATTLKYELISLPEISSVDLIGSPEKEISIEISQTQMKKFGLSMFEVRQKINSHSVNLTPGKIEYGGSQIILQFYNKKRTGEELGEIPLIVAPSGNLIRLRDIATIRDEFEEQEIYSLVNGSPAVLLRVRSVGNQSNQGISSAAQSLLKQFQPSDNISVRVLYDTSQIQQERIQGLLSNGLIGLLLVFIFLAFVLDLRNAVWATIGIPVSFLGALVFFPIAGLTIDSLTLFALFLMIGIVVDDAVVVSESIAAHRDKGLGPIEASIKGTRVVSNPIIIGSLTTIIAVFPLYFLSEYRYQIFNVIPIVVLFVLIISLLDAFYILPGKLAFQNDWSKPPVSNWKNWINQRLLQFRERIVMASVTWSLGKVWIAMGIGLLVIVASLLMVRFDIVKLRFTDNESGIRPIMKVDIKLPNGSSFDTTLGIAERFKDAALAINDEFEQEAIRDISITVGQKVSSQIFRLDVNGSNLATVTAYLNNYPSRTLHQTEIEEIWRRNLGDLPTIEDVEFGYYIGFVDQNLSFSLSHPDIRVMYEAIGEIRNRLERTDGIGLITDNLSLSNRQFQMELTPFARSKGFTPSSIGLQLRNRLTGIEAQDIQRGGEEIPVVVSLPEDDTITLKDLGTTKILHNGWPVELSELVTFTEIRDLEVLTSYDGNLSFSIAASADVSVVNPRSFTRQLEEGLFNDLRMENPGLIINKEGNSRIFGSLVEDLSFYFPAALILIYLLLAAFLRSYWKPLLIVVGIPIALSGSIFLHWILGYVFSVISFLGLIAVSGVIVNDSLLILDRYNTLKRENPDMLAIVGASIATRERFRAVLLTTVTSVLGLTPLLYTKTDAMIGLIPFVVSFLGGMVFTLIFVLIFLPSLIVIIDGRRE